MVPGLQMAPKTSTIIFDAELGNPYTLLTRGMEVVRPKDGVDGQDVPRSECLPVMGGIEVYTLT